MSRRRVAALKWVAEFKRGKLPKMEFAFTKPVGRDFAWKHMKQTLKEQFKINRVPHGTKLTPESVK